MKILVYRRTHIGDPNHETQTFGIADCMGSVRNWTYDAVIGIGGTKPDRGHEGIKEKITWVGITPIFLKFDDQKCKNFRGKLVSFETFKVWDENGMPVEGNYPKLYKYMFEDRKIPRAALNFPKDIRAELLDILEMTKKEIANYAAQPRNNVLLSNSKKVALTCQFSVEENRIGCI